MSPSTILPEQVLTHRRRPRVIATLFDQRSTRTRLGFQAAAARLGHQSIDAYDTDRSRMGTSTGESIEDHIHTVELYSDLLVVRSHLEDMPYRVSRLSYLPVINAGNGADEHPSQALIDLFAIRQMRGEIEKLSIALSSDTRARFAVSFVKMLRLTPPRRFTLCCLPGIAINPAMREAMTVLAGLGTEIGIVHDVRHTLDHDILSIQMQDMSKFAHAGLGNAAVDKEKVGSKAWFEALGACNKANGDHMAEEERQGLTDFRQHASLQERHDLAVKFAAFEADHLMGVKPVDKDPKKWVRDHAPH